MRRVLRAARGRRLLGGASTDESQEDQSEGNDSHACSSFGRKLAPHKRDHCRPLDADLRRLGTRKCESLSVDVRDVAIAELLSRMPGIDHIVGAMAQRGYKSEFEANATL